MKQHSPRFLSLVLEAKKNIHEITAITLKTLLDSEKSFYLLDIREDKELVNGIIPEALPITKGVIERDIETLIPDTEAEIVVYCSGGFRSALVAESLQNMGYLNVFSLDKGLQSWIEAGYSLAPFR